MITVKSYDLRPYDRDRTGKITVVVPSEHEIMSVGLESDTPTIYLLSDTDSPPMEMAFWLLATDAEMPDEVIEYIGTVETRGGVWHVFAELAILEFLPDDH